MPCLMSGFFHVALKKLAAVSTFLWALNSLSSFVSKDQWWIQKSLKRIAIGKTFPSHNQHDHILVMTKIKVLLLLCISLSQDKTTRYERKDASYNDLLQLTYCHCRHCILTIYLENNPLVDDVLNSYDLTASCCIATVRRNYRLATCSWKGKNS